MNSFDATKENAEEALRRLYELVLVETSAAGDNVKFLREFLEAAKKKLPSRATVERHRRTSRAKKS